MLRLMAILLLVTLTKTL
jgi:hypothetical protein